MDKPVTFDHIVVEPCSMLRCKHCGERVVLADKDEKATIRSALSFLGRHGACEEKKVP